ncbi:hypothetical protein ACS0TY_025476 [Phlomoides rotata]
MYAVWMLGCVWGVESLRLETSHLLLEQILITWDSISVEVMSGAKVLLENVRSTPRSFTLGWEFVMVVSMMATNSWQLPQSEYFWHHWLAGIFTKP